jgi:hypothetical protein
MAKRPEPPRSPPAAKIRPPLRGNQSKKEERNKPMAYAASQEKEPKEPEKDPKEPEGPPPSPEEVQKLNEQKTKLEAKLESAKEHTPGTIPPLGPPPSMAELAGKEKK